MTGLTERLALPLEMNESIVCNVLQELLRCRVRDICICAGNRNLPFLAALEKTSLFNLYFWPEERSAAFFALGKSKQTGCPTVVLTTSGTATGELLPATMEAYYTGIPLILLTTDRPRCYRGSGAPQCAEQVGIYGKYAVFEQDIEGYESLDLKSWQQNGPAHLNVCFDEPLKQKFENIPEFEKDKVYSFQVKDNLTNAVSRLDKFIHQSHHPLVIVSALDEQSRESVIHFLEKYQAPVYLEGVSGIREDTRLTHLRISNSEQLWRSAEAAGYPIDGILRIGTIPTVRLWRDLENRKGQIHLCSLSQLTSSGLSWVPSMDAIPLAAFFENYSCQVTINAQNWITADKKQSQAISKLLHEEPLAEAALVHQLSKQIASTSLVYLGNSLPIREWDAYATYETAHSHVFANRGLNGIDGQISTFLGMCSPQKNNWAIIGDLTALYDLVAPWILQQMKEMDLNLVIINNGGGKIFDHLSELKCMQNLHQIHFKPFADLWHLDYIQLRHIPEKIPYGGQRLIEIVPDEEATQRFYKKKEQR